MRRWPRLPRTYLGGADEFTQPNGDAADRVDMSKPRRIVPHGTYAVCRRVTQRQFLLRPEAIVNQIFLYCLAVAAKRFDIEIIAFCMMSNHYHGVFYDPTGRLPAFLAMFHRIVACSMNAFHGRLENFWASTETSVVELGTPGDVFEKALYALANPVTANLVETVAEWPGASSLQLLDGLPCVIARPEYFFSAKSKTMPEVVELRLSAPPGTESFESFATRLRQAIPKREARLELVRTEPVLGLAGIEATGPTQVAATKEGRCAIRPTVACKKTKIRIAMLAVYADFYEKYGVARERMMRGEKDVVFPPGTYRFVMFTAGYVPAPAPPAKDETRRKRTTAS